MADHKRPRGAQSASEYEAPDVDDDDELVESGEPSNKKMKAGFDDDDDDAAEEGTGYKPTIDLSIGGDAAWKRPSLASLNPVTDNLSQLQSHR
jgi:hypothetical protein